MYAASQATSTAIVPFPTPKTKTDKGLQPYILLYTNDNGTTTTVDVSGPTAFVGATLSETDANTPNKALTVQLTGMTVVRLTTAAAKKKSNFGKIMYGADNGEASFDATSNSPVVGRFLEDLGEQEGHHFASMLICRSASKRYETSAGIYYQSRYSDDLVGDVIFRPGCVPSNDCNIQMRAGDVPSFKADLSEAELGAIRWLVN